jgi:hypothetical protein
MSRLDFELGRSLDTLTSDFESATESAPSQNYGIYPYHKYRRAWEFVIFFLAMVCMCELPYEWAFNLERSFLYILPALIIDLFFFVDIFIVLRTGVLQYGIIKLDKETIRNSISRWRLIVYWLSPWPYYLIGYFLNNDHLFNALIALKALRFVRLYDSVKIIRNTLVYINPISRMTLLFTVWLTIAHFSACAFWYAGWIEIPGQSWLIESKLLSHPKPIQYFYALYYITTAS